MALTDNQMAALDELAATPPTAAKVVRMDAGDYHRMIGAFGSVVAEVRSLRGRLAAADYLHRACNILDVDDACEDCNNALHGFEGEGGDWLCPDRHVATVCYTCRDTDGDPQIWPCPTHTALHPNDHI